MSSSEEEDSGSGSGSEDDSGSGSGSGSKEENEEEEEEEEEEAQTAMPDAARDLAVLREVSARMDDTFARLLLRYPPARASDSSGRTRTGPAAAGGAGAPHEPAARGSNGGPPRTTFGNSSSQANAQGGGARYSRFAKHAAQLAALEAPRAHAPEDERPPLSEAEHAGRDALVQRCVAEFSRPDAADALTETEPALGMGAVGLLGAAAARARRSLAPSSVAAPPSSAAAPPATKPRLGLGAAGLLGGAAARAKARRPAATAEPASAGLLGAAAAKRVPPAPEAGAAAMPAPVTPAPFTSPEVLNRSPAERPRVGFGAAGLLGAAAARARGRAAPGAEAPPPSPPDPAETLARAPRPPTLSFGPAGATAPRPPTLKFGPAGLLAGAAASRARSRADTAGPATGAFGPATPAPEPGVHAPEHVEEAAPAAPTAPAGLSFRMAARAQAARARARAQIRARAREAGDGISEGGDDGDPVAAALRFVGGDDVDEAIAIYLKRSELLDAADELLDPANASTAAHDAFEQRCLDARV